MNTVITTQRPAQPETQSGLAAGLVSRPIVIQNVQPQIDNGRWPVKREVGDDLEITAEIFRDGHVVLSAVILWRRADEATWRETPMAPLNPGLDLWSGTIRLDANTTYVYTVEAWTNAYQTWSDELDKKVADGQVVTLELIEGRALVEEAGRRAQGDDADLLSDGCARALTLLDGEAEFSGITFQADGSGFYQHLQHRAQDGDATPGTSELIFVTAAQ